MTNAVTAAEPVAGQPRTPRPRPLCRCLFFFLFFSPNFSVRLVPAGRRRKAELEVSLHTLTSKGGKRLKILN